jgi:DNA topoisomerase-1
MNILVVESKAKCKTLLKHLGKDAWRVMPTGGHIERLAEDRTLHPPKEVKKAYWSHAAGELPKPPWFWTERGEAAIKAIREEAAKHDSVSFYLAADPDREGERIAWHLERLLSDLGPCHRVTFQEVTAAAVLEAVAAPGEVDQALVDAALIRTFVDRLVGWRASKIAKRYTTTSSNSMGRVQTPTLGFVVERELEREAHVPVRYFEVLAGTALTDWRVRFHEKSDAQAWVDEKNRFNAHRTSDAELAQSAHHALGAAGEVVVSDVTRKTRSESPKAPFSTDTLLQTAGSRWGWSPKKTAALAGQLYEAGHLTYIRTDSTRLAAEAVEAARAVVSDTWGAERLGAAASAAAAKPTGNAPAAVPSDQADNAPAAAASSAAAAPSAPAAGVQDAHEAIRPTDLTCAQLPDVEPDVQKLYALVRARTLASLMIPSQRITLSLKARCDGLDRVLEGTVGWYAEPGWRQAFVGEGLDDAPPTEPLTVDNGTTLALTPGDDEHPNPELREDQTKPPARYRPHTLVGAMKDAGIGRPSTYAKTVERLEDRRYVVVEDGALAPTESGRNIWLEAAPLFCLPNEGELFQTGYSADMEALLDRVAERQHDASKAWETMLDDFKAAHGNAQQASADGPLQPRTRLKLEEFREAAPELTDEIGDLDTMTQQTGKTLLADLRERGIDLLPSQNQQDFLDKLLESTGLSLAEAVEAADLRLAGDLPNRAEASALIEHLKAAQAESRVPTPKQRRWIVDLTKKAELDEGKACALVGVAAYNELSGGKEGTASALIDALLARTKGKGSGKPAAKPG